MAIGVATKKRISGNELLLVIFLVAVAPVASAEMKTVKPEIAQELLDLAKRSTELSQVGKYREAIELATRALHIRETAFGPEHPDTAVSFLKLAYLYRQVGDYARARTMAQHALGIDQKALGEEHESVADCFDVLGGIERDAGELTKSETCYRRALRIKERTRGENDLSTANTLNNLALTCKGKANYRQAESLYRRALGIKEKTLGPSHPETATALANLASLYLEMREFGKAEPLFKRALEIEEKTFSSRDPRIIAALNGLASFYHDMRDEERAEPIYRRVVAIAEEAFGLGDPKTATALHNLAALYADMGKPAVAEPLLERALEISERSLGSESLATAAGLAYLADVAKAQRQYEKAESLYRRAWAIEKQVLGPDHPICAATAGLLGKVYFARQDYDKAQQLFEQALSLNESVYGPAHRNTGAALDLLAQLHLARGDHDAALPLARRARNIEDRELEDVLAFAPEAQRISFSAEFTPSLLATLGSATDVARAILRWKGATLDSMVKDRRLAGVASQSNLMASLDQLRLTRERLFQITYASMPYASDEALHHRESDRQQLLLRAEAIEAEIASAAHVKRVSGGITSVSVAEVQAVLTTDQTLIELLRYDHYLGTSAFERRYGAIAISCAGAPKWIPLGNASEIEKTTRRYQESVRGETDEKVLHDTLRELHTEIWAPIEKALPLGTERLILSPDGELNFISFATLIDSEDRFLAERYSIRYVASGRDLLVEKKSGGSDPVTVVFANADFAGDAISPLTGTIAAAARSMETRDLQNLSLPSLPGTAVEAVALETLAEKANGKVKVFLGADATEAELRRVNSPRILHLATHGFFLPETEIGEEADPLRLLNPIPPRMLLNPMHRSGLALAGAQKTLRAWSRGDIPPTENDGIVTAEEVGGLKLEGTWLVVLSACDTGSGEARAGEGVMGLRRGFIQAGAQNLLMTLWPIGDKTTVEIMVDFYEAAEKSKNAPQALADVQRDWLVRLRKERGLEVAVRFAGPFIMSSQGHP